MGVNFEYSDGQTPIEEEEREGLKIKTISTKDEFVSVSFPKNRPFKN